ncbi:hypothetical protein [Leptobacterium sp. I13]|uniref:hypothetical protein n=1 Tax=Leptobacterium meishanense TaxID=3128904 RepID=UPI0030EF52C8
MHTEDGITQENNPIREELKSTKAKLKKQRIFKWLFFSAFVAVTSIASYIIILDEIEDAKERKLAAIKKTEEERIATIKKAIERMLQEEVNYLQVASSNNSDYVAKQNAALIYRTRTNRLLEEINTQITTEDLSNIDPNLLMDYARHLDKSGDVKQAEVLYQQIVNTSKDTTLMTYAMRSLAKLYADNSSSLFNESLSRDFRKKNIQIVKEDKNLTRYLHMAELYELWAMDEYTQFKDLEMGNKVIDTAFYCVDKLPDYNKQKQAIHKRLIEAYNFHNNVLIPENTTGDYKFYIENVGAGNAYITITSAQEASITIDYLDEGKLIGRLKGTGSYIDLNTLKFDVRTESYSAVFKSSKSTSGTLELTAKEGKQFTGSLNEYGEKTTAVRLVKQ